MNNFQQSMEQHLVAFKENYQFLPAKNPKKAWQYPDVSDNLYPPIRHSVLQYIYDNAVPLHDYANHVRSSQMFAFNLLYPLCAYSPDRLTQFLRSRTGFPLNKLENFVFEFSPDTDLLGEWRGTTKPDDYVTAVDVALFFDCDDGSKATIFFEVKFTEEGFSACNGYTSAGNSSRKDCEDWSALCADLKYCYLEKPFRNRAARNYLSIFGDPAQTFIATPGKCPFINNHQCLRNHALLRAVAEHQSGRRLFALVVHDGNQSIRTDWQGYHNLLLPAGQQETALILASELLQISSDATHQRYVKERYLLPQL